MPMRTWLPDGSRNAQSRTPYGWSMGSCTTSAPQASTFSNRLVDVVGADEHAVERALGQQAGEQVAVLVGVTHARGYEDDLEVGLRRRRDREPAEAGERDVDLDFEAERIAIEGERLVLVVDGDERVGDGEVHVAERYARAATEASPIPARPRDGLGEAGRDRCRGPVVAVAVGARRLADELGETRAERAQRRTSDRHADLGDAEVASPQERLRPLDASGHQIAVRRLAVGRA